MTTGKDTTCEKRKSGKKHPKQKWEKQGNKHDDDKGEKNMLIIRKEWRFRASVNLYMKASFELKTAIMFLLYFHS